MELKEINKQIVSIFNSQVDSYVKNQLLKSAVQNRNVQLIDDILRSKSKKEHLKSLKENDQHKILLCRYGDKRLLELLDSHKIGLEVDKGLDPDNNHCSHYAANEGNVYILGEIYRKKGDIDQLNNENENAVMSCIKRGKRNRIQTILSIYQKSNLLQLDNQMRLAHQLCMDIKSSSFSRLQELMSKEYYMQLQMKVNNQ